MKRPDDGGPAFPANSIWRDDMTTLITPASCGMSLRQYYAGQAAIGISASCAYYDGTDGVKEHPEIVAAAAVSVADALIAELRKGEGE